MRLVRRFSGWFAVAAFVAVAAFASTFVRAQTDGSQQALHLTTSPLPISLVGEPGSSLKAELKIKNSGPKSEVLKVGLLKFSAYGEEGQPELKDRQTGDDYFDWVHFSDTQINAEPGEWHTVTMTIDLPKDAALGYYYAVTFSRLKPPESTQNNKLQGGAATLVLVEVKGSDLKRELKIESFTTSRRVYEFLPATFTVKLKNTGNIHAAPTGNIFIKRGDETIATLDVNQSSGNILPDSKRIFNADWSDGFPVYTIKEEDGKAVVKDGKQVSELSWDISKVGHLKIGHYTASLVMTYDDGTRDIPLEATVSFWVIPWRLIFAVIVPVVGIGLLIYSYIRLRTRVKKLQTIEEE